MVFPFLNTFCFRHIEFPDFTLKRCRIEKLAYPLHRSLAVQRSVRPVPVVIVVPERQFFSYRLRIARNVVQTGLKFFLVRTLRTFNLSIQVGVPSIMSTLSEAGMKFVL